MNSSILLVLSLMAGCQATEPRALQAVTTTPGTTVTTTPGTTVTTTPGSTNQVTFEATTSPSRRLSDIIWIDVDPGVSATSAQMQLAACKVFAALTADCSTTASLSGTVWTITSYLTTTAAKAATQTSSLNAYKSNTAALGTAMTTQLKEVGASVTMSVTSEVTVTTVAARVYAPQAAVTYVDKPWNLDYAFGTRYCTTVPSWSAADTTVYATALTQTLEAVGFTSSYIGVNFDVSSDLNYSAAHVSIYVPLAYANQTSAIAQWMLPHENAGSPTFVQDTFAQKMAALLPDWKSCTSVAVVFFQIPSWPSNTAALGVNVTVNGSYPYTGVAEVLGWGNGLYDLDDGDDLHKTTNAAMAAGSGAWILPMAGVFGLFFMVAMIGLNIRRSRSRVVAPAEERETFMEVLHNDMSDMEASLE
jgi:hypothetical protein